MTPTSAPMICGANSETIPEIHSPIQVVTKVYHPLASCQEKNVTIVYNSLILGAQKWSGRTSVSGEAGWAGETRTATPKNSQNVPHYHLKEARAICD